MFKLPYNANKTVLKIIQAKLQQYLNWELLDVQVGFRKGRGTKVQIANIHWIKKKQGTFQKKSTFASLTTLKPLTMWVTTNWEILKEMRIPNHSTCVLRNLHAGPEATVRTTYGTKDWFKIRRGVCQNYILSPCLFNLHSILVHHVKYQAGWLISWNQDCWQKYQICRYVDCIAFMAENEEELTSLLKIVKEESEKAGLNSTFKKQRSLHPVTSHHGK